MKIHHLRNATFVIESQEKYILIDPMLSEKGKIPPYSVFRHKAQKNPIVSLPPNAEAILAQVTSCLITHSQKWGLDPLTHTDHLDKLGKSFLKKKHIPVTTLRKDADYLKRNGLDVETELDYWKPVIYLDGLIAAVPARHGHGWIHRLMANGAGFYLELPGEPSIYISGDTVYTDDVRKALHQFKPDIAVVASGNASLDIGQPLLMSLDEIVNFIEAAPGKVIANHLEALNHCPITRAQLRETLQEKNLLSKTFIPEDGEIILIEK